MCMEPTWLASTKTFSSQLIESEDAKLVVMMKRKIILVFLPDVTEVKLQLRVGDDVKSLN
ncbi:hypothetical protein EGR_05459 [Echinococcus granulosus]|uniref:Uncharacterized protein n=1 Tax=Echinococcus granulosus TaxID=6210 RepID=W6UNB0_ECHGR|nr:hypothetical protein EGR_05459 [Echinococcus granulosus]EUB59697.1 hypothetical protein EGR_05459 [Echinococcus granulosus]